MIFCVRWNEVLFSPNAGCRGSNISVYQPAGNHEMHQNTKEEFLFYILEHLQQCKSAGALRPLSSALP